MKILLIGASGTIGKAVAEHLGQGNTIVTAGYTHGDVTVDLNDPASIQGMFDHIGHVDAIISTAGIANFGAFQTLPDSEYQLALNNKLMGQVNVVRIGRNYINTNGSITLTSGVLAQTPMPGSVLISMANGALESFVKAAALELTAFRLNIVSPQFVKETMATMGMDTSTGVSAADTAKAYAAAVNKSMHGTTLDVSTYINCH